MAVIVTANQRFNALASYDGAHYSGYPNGDKPDSGGGATILWQDDIQAFVNNRAGFGYVMLEHPVNTAVAGSGGAIGAGSDANGANVSRVADPAGGAGYALRLLGDFGNGSGASSARAEVDLLSQNNATFAAQAWSAEGIYVAMEWYFPQAITNAGTFADAWINLMDWHAVGGGVRWHTSPGLFLRPGSNMYPRWQWNAAGYADSAVSSVQFPVGRWFPIEMYYRSSTSSVTLSLWIDGQLAITQTVPATRLSTQTDSVEFNIKNYGASVGTAWSQTPTIRYIRNVRFAASRITG